jgi:ABC-type uncharacterized transport system permease subunit
MDAQHLSTTAAAAAYAVSAVAYGVNFYRKGRAPQRSGTWILVAGWLLQSASLGLIVARTGGLPLTSQVLPSICAWLVVVVYLYLEWTTKDRAFGALVVPIVAVLHLLAASQIVSGEALRQVSHSENWFKLHVLAYILAYAGFAISCVSSIMYVMLFGEIQQKHLGFFYERLPSLGVLDQITNRSTNLGFVCLTAGVVASSVWAHQANYAMGVWAHPAFAPLLVAWVIYAAHLGVRWFAGWQGRRAAYFSILGFVLVVSAFPVVGFFTSGQHPLSP